jgi:hypothetical protein
MDDHDDPATCRRAGMARDRLYRHAEGLSVADGFPSLTLQVQEILHRDPLGGHLFRFRGHRGNLLKTPT